MTTTFYALDTKIFIPKKEVQFVLSRLTEFAISRGGACCTNTRADLALETQCREAWGFNILFNDGGDVVGLYPDHSDYRRWENNSDDTYYKLFFDLLAPSVKDGSFLTYMCFGGGGEPSLWGWRFRRGASGRVEAELEDSVFCVFESDLTPEQVRYYVEEEE